MSRLAQQAVTDATQALTQAGASGPVDQDALEEALQSVRMRVRTADHHGSADAQRQGLIRTLRPLWHFVCSQPELAHIPMDVRSDLVWNLYAASMARTANADAFPTYTSDVAAWQEVMDSLQRGEQLAGPMASSGQRQVGSRTWKALVLGLVMLAAESWIPSGRMRFYVFIAGLGLVMF